MQEIGLGLDTYLYNRTECDSDLKPLKDKFWLEKSVSDRIFDFSSRWEMLEYFNAARSLGALFSYISAIIFSRQRWCQVAIDDQTAGSNYQHVSTLFTILGRGGKHKYIRQPLVFCRGQNDSFLQKGDSGIVARFLIDIDGYHLLGERLFSDREMRMAFMKVMQYEHHWFMWIRLAIRVQDDTLWKNIKLKLLDYGYTLGQLGLINSIRRIEHYLPILNFVRLIRKRLVA
jgi:abequosyltransferase